MNNKKNKSINFRYSTYQKHKSAIDRFLVTLGHPNEDGLSRASISNKNPAHNILTKWRTILREIGFFADYEAGYYDYINDKDHRATTVVPSEVLVNAIQSHHFDIKKKSYGSAFHPTEEQLANQMSEWNSLYCNYTYDLCDAPWYFQKPLTEKGNPHGRFYTCGSANHLQGMVESARLKLLVDGYATPESDVNACLPSILLGADLARNGKLYIDIYSVVPGFDRDVIKQAFVILLANPNAKAWNSLIKPINPGETRKHWEMRNAENQKKRKYFQGKANFKAVKEAILKMFPKMKSVVKQETYNELMYLESQWTITVINELLVNRGIWAASIHDCIKAMEQNLDEVRDVMEEKWNEIFGFYPLLKEPKYADYSSKGNIDFNMIVDMVNQFCIYSKPYCPTKTEDSLYTKGARGQEGAEGRLLSSIRFSGTVGRGSGQYSEIDVSLVHSLKAKGKSLRTIAKETGYSKSAVDRALKREPIQPEIKTMEKEIKVEPVIQEKILAPEYVTIRIDGIRQRLDLTIPADLERYADYQFGAPQ